MKVHNYVIDIEGIDKTGKDLIKHYITQLANYKYVVHSRGILSNMVYAEKYNRDYDYDILYRPIVVYLHVNEEDRRIRCISTNEPYIDANVDRALFEKYINIIENEGIIVLRFNTSEKTPYIIAKEVINYIENM